MIAHFDELRLLVVVTYRPSDILLAARPFLEIKPDLEARGSCREFPLEFLGRPEVESYLDLTFPDHRFPEELPALIQGKTDGNPLFLTDLARYLRDCSVLSEKRRSA